MDIKNIRPESLYNTVSTIQQNVFVFNASIRDNVTMFQEFPKEEVDRVIEMAGLQELIAEKGEDYLCGENGSGLSGGEKQRISIARALLRNAKMLLIDEATAALDTETSSRIIKAILALKNMTRIVVTHDLDAGTLQKYDSILTLKNGRIVEDGSFDTLMKNKGYFYSLYTVAQ
jgi:ABC-type multidrug transport system fused ATPase/permease subunit